VTSRLGIREVQDWKGKGILRKEEYKLEKNRIGGDW